MNLEEMEKRLRRLEDVEAIKALHRDYIFGLNNRQWHEMAGCFTDDAKALIFRHPLCEGKEQISRLFTDTMSRVNTGKGRDAHFATMPVVSVEGDRARGHWLLYILIADPETGNAWKWTQGRYECEYRRVQDQWKFSKLVWVNPWPRTPESLPGLEDVMALGIEL